MRVVHLNTRYINQILTDDEAITAFLHALCINLAPHTYVMCQEVWTVVHL